MNPKLRKQRNLVLAAGFLTAASWAIPFLNLVLLPLQFLNTHLHELCHAIAGVATGARVPYLLVFNNGSGVTLIEGGSMFISASAGYVGAAIIGAAIIYFGRTEKRAKRVLGVLATSLAISMLIWVRGELAGVATGLLWTAILGGLAVKGRGDALVLACQFLGIQQALSSIQSVYLLFKLTTYGHAQNDAAILEQITRIPAVFWAVSWVGISLALVALALKKSWEKPLHD